MRVKDTYDKFSEWTIHPSPWTSPLLLAFFSSQMCQNLRFLSPAPVTSTTPFGDKAEKSTRASCASLISKIFAFGPAPVPPLPIRPRMNQMEGYAQPAVAFPRINGSQAPSSHQPSARLSLEHLSGTYAAVYHSLYSR